MTSGSPLWQTIFLLLAVVVIVFELIRGWRHGFMRQLVRLFAVIAAYITAVFGGRLLLPVARPFLKIPDSLIAVTAGMVLALVVYSVISSLGRISFKRTNQHRSVSLRLFSGISGAALGLLFGLFLIWLGVITIRSLGAVADGQIRAIGTGDSLSATPGAAPQAVHAIYSPTADVAERKEEPSSIVALLARLKNSIELGPLGCVVERTDLVPQGTYDVFDKLGQLLSQPESAQRFLSFPEARELSANPKIAALRVDPEIADLISRGRFVDLLQNDKILDAANDPVLAKQIQKFDLRRALEYALGPRSVEAVKR